MKVIVKVLLFSSLFSLAILFLDKTQFGHRFFKWSVKKSFMYMLDNQQFERLYGSRCLLTNTFVKTDSVPDVDYCELCENARVVELGIEDTNSLADLLHWDTPIVVVNSSYQPATDLYQFTNSFLSKKDLAMFHPCQFKSNIKSKVREHRQLMQMISTGKKSGVYALWENCADIALKAFREFYTRPAFLGNNVQLTGTNWAYICSDYESRVYKEIETFSQLVVVFVAKGQADVRLSPHELCFESCSELYVNVSSGDILLFSGNVYSLSIRPVCTNSETIMYGVGGYFD